MDISKLSSELSKKTKAVLPTHMFGYTMDTEKVRNMASNKTLVIEDCALALLSEHKGKTVGNIGDAAIYSLNIGKTISTIEGGVITTNDDKIHQRIKDFLSKNSKRYSYKTKMNILAKFFASYFTKNKYSYSAMYSIWNNTKSIKNMTQNWDFDNISLPTNSFEYFNSIQAKIGLTQIKKAPDIIEKRRKNASAYSKRIHNDKIRLSPYISRVSYSHYPVLVKDRQSFLDYMVKKGVHLGVNFDYSIPYTNLYQKYRKKECPNSLATASQIVNLPIYSNLKKKELDRVIDLTNDWN